MTQRFSPCRIWKWNAFFLIFFTTAQLILVRIEAFQSAWTRKNAIGGSVSHPIRTTELSVLAEPHRDLLQSGNERQQYSTKPRYYRNTSVKQKRRPSHKNEDVWSSGRWGRAICTESNLLQALEALEQSVKLHHSGIDNSLLVEDSFSFPPIRSCNAALAAFGDGQDLLRALRLYFKMRKASSLSQRYFPRSRQSFPTPTLVTFSTIMSRAVQLGKPLVAIRIWNIMRRQTNFFSAVSSVSHSSRIFPDVKSANILMNCYAKLGYIESAQNLLAQMVEGCGEDVPLMKPNLVTYNTLLDACHKAGELDAALEIKERIETSGIMTDARTYTTLIATVARKASTTSGANDPTMAFSFLKEMQGRSIRPNGMTYSALIDVCGRCKRSDLALKGLRMMSDQKADEQRMLNQPPEKRYTLPGEVGAWTAAINACGKAGRIETANKLFYSMPNFGVYPNTITCGCLTDSLLRNGKMTETLEVLRYMKKYRIAPSEVMYTSLMTSAGRLAQLESGKQNVRVERSSTFNDVSFPINESGATSAVEVYTELMTSLMQLPRKNGRHGIDSSVFMKKGDDTSELYRVSLVFQEMKASGVEPDLGCYNALLKSCANAGDVDRASEIFEQIRLSDDMDPNDKSWREMIRAAGMANRVDIALSTWKTAVAEMKETDDESSRAPRLSDRSLVALLETLIRASSDAKIDKHTKLRLCQVVAKICEAIISGSNYLGMNLVDRQGTLDNPRAMIIFLQSLVTLEQKSRNEDDSSNVNPNKLRLLAASIVTAECFKSGLPQNLRRHSPYVSAYQIAQSWVDKEDWPWR